MTTEPRIWVVTSSDYVWHWLWEWDDDSGEPVGKWTLHYECICPGEMFLPGKVSPTPKPTVDPSEMKTIATAKVVDW